MVKKLPDEGRALIAASWLGTVVFIVSAVLSAVAPGLRAVGVVVAVTLFGLGIVAFVISYAAAVERSRTEELSVVGLYFLAGSAPSVVRWHLLGAATVQTVVAFATASARPFTSVAFGILVPMYGLGMAGLWGARHGQFPERRNLRLKKQRTR